MKTIIAVILMTAGLSAAQAMPPRGPHPEMLATYLQLTEAQQTKLRQIMEAQRERHKKLREEFRNELTGIMTDEQKKRFEALRQDRRRDRGCGNKQSRGPLGQEERLGLSPPPDRTF